MAGGPLIFTAMHQMVTSLPELVNEMSVSQG
jgi:hypothetical protein